MARVFVSHYHADSDLAMEIKAELERFGVSVFVAHRDIVPASEWRDEIKKQIGECELLVALLTNNYKQSAWTDQECGMAIAEGRVVLPVAIELMPYGFMEQYQALIWDKQEHKESVRKLLSVVFSKLRVPTEGLVRGFESSPSYDDSGFGIQLVLGRDDLTRDQIVRVARASVKNRQIFEAGSSQEGLVEFFNRYGESIPADIRARRARILRAAQG